MNLTDIVKQLDPSWDTALIKEGGKNPTKASIDGHIKPHHAKELLESSTNCRALGLYTKRNQLVCIDIDERLDAFFGTYSTVKEIKQAPQVRSERPNAAKLFFKNSQGLELETVACKRSPFRGAEFFYADNRQCLIWGEYPGKVNKETGEILVPAGEYRLVAGSFEDIPELPEVFARAMLPVEKTVRSKPTLGNLQRFSGEHAIRLCQQCFSVIPNAEYHDIGDRDSWLKLGMACHNLAHETDYPEWVVDGILNTWREWSKADERYADCWNKGQDPCLSAWRSFKPGGGRTLGTLIGEARRWDPEDLRFRGDPELEKVFRETFEPTKFFKNLEVTISFHDAMQKMEAINKLPSIAERNWLVNALALEAGFRGDKAGFINVYLDYISEKKNRETRTLEALMEENFNEDFVIPDMLASPSVTIVYGEGGHGKSSFMWGLMKHISDGNSLMLAKEQPVPVKQGTVLLLTGDQPDAITKKQAIDAEIQWGCNIHVEPDFNLQDFPRFLSLMERYEPVAVVIDSIGGCMRNADEIKGEYAYPIRWLANNNGSLWTSAAILLIHHTNGSGGMRGSRTLRAAPDAVWSFRKPETTEQKNLPAASRIITIEKCRQGLEGRRFRWTIDPVSDLGYIEGMGSVDDKDSAPASVTDKVMMRLAGAFPYDMTVKELQEHKLVGGNVRAIQKAVYRLEQRKRIAVARTTTAGNGSPAKHYRAVLGDGGGLYSVQDLGENEQIPFSARGLKSDTPETPKTECLPSNPKVDTPTQNASLDDMCPTSDPNDDGENSQKRQNFQRYRKTPPSLPPESPHQAVISADWSDAFKKWS